MRVERDYNVVALRYVVQGRLHVLTNGRGDCLARRCIEVLHRGNGRGVDVDFTLQGVRGKAKDQVPNLIS